MRIQPNGKGIYDFDALVVEPRIVRVGGEETDVSVIPVAVVLAMAQYKDRTREQISEDVEKDPNDYYRRIVQTLSDVCIRTNPKFTVEFLMTHLDEARLSAFVDVVLFPAKKKAEEFLEGGGGNPTTDEPQST